MSGRDDRHGAEWPVGPSRAAPDETSSLESTTTRAARAEQEPTRPEPEPRKRRTPSTLIVGVLAGVLIGATAITAQGDDLRPGRTSDLAVLVAQAEQRNIELASRASELREINDQLTAAQGAAPANSLPSQQMEVQMAGLAAVRGPGVRVTLTDAPVDFAPPGVDGDLLVVHEQDIQHVVNALWAAGAEAMTIQGQRVVAMTAVKCVGNTVVLHGTPYAPPYVITAIGDPAQLEAGLASDRGVQIYRQYALAYHLGYEQGRVAGVTMPAFEGPLPQMAAAGGR